MWVVAQGLSYLLLFHAAGALDCWAGDFTAATCCDASHGPSGNPSCWDGVYTYEACCMKKRPAPKPRSSRSQEVSSKENQPPSSSDSKNPVAVAPRKKKAIDGVVVGIDLGTTYSAVAIFRNGRTEVIPNDQGNRITPSVVSFLHGGERLVGEAAKNLLSEFPKNTVYDAKRLIGRGFQDRSVQMDRKSFPFRVVDRGGRPHIEVEKANKKSMVLAPEEVSAMILMKMRVIAEAYIGEEVRHAVVTVPAYFTDNQRSATMVAGEIAGINIVRIINEPTAAAIAYGFHHRRPKKGRSETRALVYDLGGGTFDVSLLNIDNGVFEVLATCGNTHLGGEDFDRNVVTYLTEQFKKKSGKDPSRDRRAMQKLKMAAEGAKRTLSTSVRATIEIESFFQGVDLAESLSRSKFEHLNSELFYKTLQPIKRVLEDAQLTVGDVDEVVLVGGSTRIPKIQQLIQDHFKLPKPPQHKVNPDEAVAVGAAIQAELLWRGSSAGQALTVVGRKTWDIVLVDVTPLSLGIEIHAGHMVVIVPRNTALPTLKTQTFTTVHDYQTTVYIPIYQGEHTVAKKNFKLGQMILSGIPPAPVGVPQVDVTFRIDANGILHVTAQDKGTQAAASVTISADKGRLSEQQVEEMIRSVQKNAEKDRELLMRNDARAALQAFVDSLRGSVINSNKLAADDQSSLEAAMNEATRFLGNSEQATVDEIQEQKSELEAVANPIIARMYGQSPPDTPRQTDEDSAEEVPVDDQNFWDEDELEL